MHRIVYLLNNAMLPKLQIVYYSTTLFLYLTLHILHTIQYIIYYTYTTQSTLTIYTTWYTMFISIDLFLVFTLLLCLTMCTMCIIQYLFDSGSHFHWQLYKQSTSYITTLHLRPVKIAIYLIENNHCNKYSQVNYIMIHAHGCVYMWCLA